MQYKNHYDTLQLNPSSSADEIKKAFRQLALQYHPDITNNDELKVEKFKTIKEAYSVLSDTEKRKAYDAKHFFFSSNNKIVTIQSILQEAALLKSKIQAVHPSKINYDYWSHELEKLFSIKSYEILDNEANSQTKEEIISLLNDISSHLTYHLMLSFNGRLQALAKGNEPLQLTLSLSLKEKKKQMLWGKYKVPLAIVIAVTVCLMIVMLAKS